MEHKEINLLSAGGFPLFFQAWTPESNPRAIVCLVHGLGEHAGRYEHVAQALTSRGFGMQAFDLRGHGRSAGKRGHVNSFEEYMQDIDFSLSTARQTYPGLPLFLYGHSLGGILVLNYALRRKPSLAGLIASSPGLRNTLQEQKLKLFLVNTLASLLPQMTVATGLDANQLSRDPEVVRKYNADPLVHGLSTYISAKKTLEVLPWTIEHAGEFPTQLPLLLMHGSGDQTCYVSGSQEFFARVPKGDKKTLKIWDGLFHEIHNEPEKGEVLAYLIDWLECNLSPK